MRIGFDFDNTLVEYDQLFYDAALRQGLIPKNLLQTKEAVKAFIQSHHTDQAFTNLQGLVYGEMIKEVKAKKSLETFLSNLVDKNHKLLIVSHKTVKPYSGANYNLRAAALQWLHDNKFTGNGGFFTEVEDVFFENTIDEKIERIKKLRCDIFFDDLPRILEGLGENITGYLYDPGNSWGNSPSYIKFADWMQVEIPAPEPVVC